MDSGGAGNGDPADGAPVRRYANDLAIDFTLSTCELRFGQRRADGEEPSVHSCIVTSPVHLAFFGRVIQATIDRYEARFGEMPHGEAD